MLEQDNFSEYDFLCLFMANVVLKGDNMVYKTSVQKRAYPFTLDEKFQPLFRNILVDHINEEVVLNKGFTQLCTMGTFCILLPSNNTKTVILFDREIAREIIDGYKDVYSSLVEEIVGSIYSDDKVSKIKNIRDYG